MSAQKLPITGGCQCGAVRYALHAQPNNAHICHCRMCQKAFGSFFASLANVARKDFEVTRGALSIFRSSDAAERGFCKDCGTPLTFRFVSRDHVNFSLGSLDDPRAVPPQKQYGMESRMPWFDALHDLPGTSTEEWAKDKPELMNEIKSTNHQHPDQDTATWPPKG